jgi:hypothetical protein
MVVRGSISKIMFPVYERCAELESDPFWKQFFSDLSKGKTPRSLFISQNGDIYKYRKASKLLVSSSKTPEEIITESKSVLARVIGKTSDKIVPLEPIIYDKWNSVRKKSMKDFFILEYVDSQMKNDESGMTLKDARMLYKKIISMTNLGLCSVEFKNGRVTGIKESIPTNTANTTTTTANSQEKQPLTGYLVANFWRAKKSW